MLHVCGWGELRVRHRGRGGGPVAGWMTGEVGCVRLSSHPTQRIRPCLPRAMTVRAEPACGDAPPSAIRSPRSSLSTRGLPQASGAPGTSVKFHKDALSPTFGPRFSTVAIVLF